MASKKRKSNQTADTGDELSGAKPPKAYFIESEDISRNERYRKFNAVLVICIIVAASVFIYLNFFYLKEDEIGEPEEKLKITPIIPNKDEGIINGHDHIQRFGVEDKWLEAMDNANVSTTVMLGSPDATFWLYPSGPFNKYNDNNEELFKLVDKYPDKFIAFPTIYTYDENKLTLLKSYIKRGALGLKLFTGHYASFYNDTGPLNESSMYPVYEYCEREKIPIIWHVHVGKEHIKNEFEQVLKDFPKLIINVPHFMLSSIDLIQNEGQGRLRYFLETYPNLYTDISFGFWVRDGMWRISNKTDVFRDFLLEFKDRFTFGTDMVMTIHPRKTVEWITNLTMAYRYILEEEHFNLTVPYDIEGDFNGDGPGTHYGLYLPQDVLDMIYYDNMVKFLAGRYSTDDLDDIMKNSRLTFRKDNTRASASDEKAGAGEIDLMIQNHGIFIAIERGSLQV